MLVENVALYRQHPANVKLPWLALAVVALSVISGGCTPAEKKSDSAPKPTTVTPVPSVPLRVWFVADAADKPVIERQWQATYEREIEVTITSAEELLQQTKPTCDTLVYPAWMLGDLVARDWLTELPAKLQASSRPPDNAEGEPTALPSGWIEQSRFNRKLWGLSLSVLPPVVMANFDLPKAREVPPNETAAVEEAIAYWQSLIEALKTARAAKDQASPASGEATAVQVDALAVCDRYLTILFSVSDDENNIGNLFQPDTLKPRVTEANFVRAAQILQDLHAAGASADSLLSSHATAWNALTSSALTVTIGFPPAPSADADKVNSIIISLPPANPVKSGARVAAGWNSGRGLIVSISKQCRQTSTANDFARWIASDESRQGFAKRIVGINSELSYAPGSSAWQAQRMVQRLGQQTRLPSEPRLPQSLAYRRALGEQIAAVVLGQKTIDAALAEVAKSWQAITDRCDPKVQIPAYVQSLGL